jgi:hypothetical protein
VWRTIKDLLVGTGPSTQPSRAVGYGSARNHLTSVFGPSASATVVALTDYVLNRDR